MWKLYYNGVLIGRNISREVMESMTRTFDARIAYGGGWHDLQFPMGDGIGTHRLLLTAATQIVFIQETL